MHITKAVAPAYIDYVTDWDYKTYLSVGGYGSGKSYHTAFKLILKLLEEKRKALVVREVFETLRDSTYDLICEILDDMGIRTDDSAVYRRSKNKVLTTVSPLRVLFPNGSSIIFKGMDKSTKLKSLNGVSIVWLEECSEIKYDGFKELLGRLRTPNVSIHFLLTCNPVGRENWVYRHFFVNIDDEGNETVIMDENKFYEKKVIVKNGVYYMHTTCDDNIFLPRDYIKTLDNIREFDEPLYIVARLGHFGANGTRVLPQFIVASSAKAFRKGVERCGLENHYFGFDFGFEESYNAVVSMAVDTKHSILYIYDEVYVNKITDDIMAKKPEMLKLKAKLNTMAETGYTSNAIIVADNEDPKAIQYYRQCGYRIRACKNKFAGSRLSNTKKVKRFKHIVCSPKCKNTIRELKELTYAKDSKGNVIYDKFNIDPHTFSAIWYALDNVTVADYKYNKRNSVAAS